MSSTYRCNLWAIIAYNTGQGHQAESHAESAILLPQGLKLQNLQLLEPPILGNRTGTDILFCVLPGHSFNIPVDFRPTHLHENIC